MLAGCGVVIEEIWWWWDVGGGGLGLVVVVGGCKEVTKGYDRDGVWSSFGVRLGDDGWW